MAGRSVDGNGLWGGRDRVIEPLEQLVMLAGQPHGLESLLDRQAALVIDIGSTDRGGLQDFTKASRLLDEAERDAAASRAGAVPTGGGGETDWSDESGTPGSRPPPGDGASPAVGAGPAGELPWPAEQPSGAFGGSLAPDLVPLAVTIRPFDGDVLRAGTAAVVGWTVANTGRVATKAPGWTDDLYLTRDGTFRGDGTDVYLGSTWTGQYAPLAPGQSYSLESRVMLPVSFTGEGYVVAVADRWNREGELNERNNVASQAARVVPGVDAGSSAEPMNYGPRVLESRGLSSAVAAQLRQGLSGFADWASGLTVLGALGQPLPRVGVEGGLSLGQLLTSASVSGRTGLGAILTERVVTPLASLLQGATTSQAIAGALGSTVGSVSSGYDAARGEFVVSFTMTNTSRRELTGSQGFTLDTGIDLDPDASGAESSLEASVDASVTTSVSGRVEVGVRVQPVGAEGVLEVLSNALTAESFFVRRIADQPLASASAEVLVRDIDVSADLGVFEAGVENGTASLRAGVSLTLNNPDGDAEGRVTLAELTGTSPASLVNVGVEPSPLSIVLPLSGRLGSYSLGSGARVEITRANVLSGSSVETVSASGINAAVASFSRLGASDVASMLTQLATSMTDLSRSGEFGGRIPFLKDKTYSQLIDLGKSLTEQLVSPLTDSATGRFAFTTIQGALRLVAERLGVDVDALNPRFDPATREFTITVDSRGSSVSEAEPGLSFDLGPIGGISIGTSGSMVRVTTEAAFTATFGVVLTALGSSAAEFQAGLALAGLNAGRGVRGVAPYRVANADGVETEREPAGAQQIRLQTRGGGPQGQSLQFDLAITGCVTVSDVVSRIVTATGGRVAVDVDEAGYRLIVRDLTTGTGTLRITTLNDSSAAIDLGLTGADEDGDGRLEGRPLHGDDWTKHAFVQEASASASMAIVTTAPIQVNARLGFMEVSGRLGVNARGTLGAALHAPGAPATSRVTLHQLVSAIGDDVSSVLTGPSVGGNASASMTDIVVTGGLVALGPNPSITVSIADLADPAAVAVQYSDGAQDLASFPKLDATTIASLMQGASSYLSTIDGLGAMKRPLPLINKSVLDLVASVTPEQIRSFASVFGGNAESVTARESLTLQSLASAMSESFGQPGGATVSYDASARVVQINLLVDRSFRRDLPFDISGTGVNLPGGHLIEAGAAGQVRVDATARVDLRMGIDLSNPLAPAPFILDTSSVVLSALASAENVRFNASLGPLGVWVGHPTLDQGLGQASLNNGANVPATFTAGLVDDTGPGGDRRYLVTELGPSVVEVAIAGRASATLPVFVGLRDNPQRLTPDVSLTVANLADPAGTTTFAAPDLASRVNQANLLTNTDAVVEGLAYLAERIDSALLDGVLNTRLPIIGSALSTVTGVLRDYRNGVDALRRQLVSGVSADVVRQVLFTSLRPVLLDTAGGSGGGADGAVTEADIVITTSPSGDNVRFDLAIGGTLAALGAISFDAGLSSLGLSITGNPSVSLSYRLDLSFGVSRADGFYFDTRKQDELVVTAEAALGGLDATGRLGFMLVSARDNAATPSRLRAVVKVDLVHPSGSGTTLPVRLMASSPRTWTNAIIEGGAALNLDLVTNMGSGQFPSLATTMRLDWPLSGPLRLSTLGQTPALSFTDIRLDLGSFLQNMARPIIDQVNRVAGPMRPVINTLTKALPVISDVMGREVTLLDLSAWYGNGRYQSSIDFVRSLSSIMNYVTPALGPGQYLNLGSFTVGGGGSGRSPIDLRMLGSLAGVQVDTSRAANTVAAMASRQDAAGDFFRKYRGLEGGGFSFPIMERPSEAFKLLMGQDATLFRYDTPRMQAGFSFSVFLPVFGVIGARFSAGMDVSGRMAFGYDTFGARKFIESITPQNPTGTIELLAAGFYVSDIDAAGKRVPLISIKGSITAAAELNVDLSFLKVRTGVSGGLYASVDVGLCRDIDDGDNDFAKVRLLKVREDLTIDYTAPTLEFSGSVGAELHAYLNARLCIGWKWAKVCWTLFDYDTRIDRVTLLDFSAGCSPQAAGQGVFTYDELSRVMTITTTGGDDSATVSRDGTTHIVRINGRQQQLVDANVASIVFRGGGGDDTLVVADNVTAEVEFEGGAGKDRLTHAGTGRVTARGGDGDDSLEGGSGDDDLQGGSGNDAIVGGGGDDEIRGEDGNDYLRGGAGNDRVWGGAGNDTISGGAGDDDLEGEAGNDTIAGDEGNDWIVGGDGNDTLSGGDGSDAAWGDGVAPGVTVGFNRTPATYDGGFVVPPAAVAGGVASTGDASGNGNDTIRGGSDEQADYLFGAGGADVIDGEAGADYVDAGDGDDSVDGGAGRDVIRGGAGNDVLRGGAGNDRIDGDADNDTLTGGSEVNDGQVNSGDDTLRGGDGDDVVDGGDGADTIEGGAGNDRLVGGRGSDWIMGGVGDDTLIGGAVASDPDVTASDRLEGGAGDDRVSAGAGSDWIVGGDGNDTIDGGGGNDVVWGDNVATVASWQNRAANFQLDGSGRAVVVGLPTLVAGFATSGAGDGNDSITTGGQSSWIFAAGGVARTDGALYGEDIIVCGAGADYVDAGAGSDSVTAGDGSASDGRNWVIGGGGDDQIRGGAGSDVIWGDNPASGVTVASFTLDGNGMPQVPSALTGGFALSSSGDDGSDVVQGGAGADWIFGSGDRTNITTGVRGDVLGGDAGNDHLDGGDGSDTITGGTGSDKALGGAGSDLIYGGSAANGGGSAQDRNELDGQGDGDTIIGDIGVDVIRGGAGGDFLRGLAGNDEMYGGDGGDTMYGNAGSDVMHGGSGAGAAADAADGSDTMYGGDGDWGGGAVTDENTLRGGRDGDTLFGDIGNDTLYGGFGGEHDTDASGDNGDVIRGLAGNDRIEGGVGDDRLYGGAGNDTIHGGSGMDLLQGDDADFAAPRGADTLVGGSDADAIVLDIQQGVTDDIQGHGVEYAGGATKPSTSDATDRDVLIINGTGVDDTITLGEAVVASGQRPLRVSYQSGGRSWTFNVEWRRGDGTPRIEQFQIEAGGGNDVVRFLQEPDGQGADAIDFTALGASEFVSQIRGGFGTDVLVGGSGRDMIVGGPGQDFIFGGAGSDRLWGDDAADGIIGVAGNGDDYIYSGVGNDEVMGQGGNDILFAGHRVTQPGGSTSLENVLIAGAELLRVGNLAGIAGLPPVNQSDQPLLGAGWTDPADRSMNRMDGGIGDDSLFGGVGADFMQGGNRATERNQLHDRSNALMRSAADNTEDWLEYARTLQNVWYYEVPDASTVDNVRISYVTSSTDTSLVGTNVIERVSGASTDLLMYLTVRQLPVGVLPGFSVADPSGPTTSTRTRWYDATRSGDASYRGEYLDSFNRYVDFGRDGYDVIIVNLKGGNDELRVGHTVRKSVWVFGGDGNDTVNVNVRGSSAIGDASQPLTAAEAATALSGAGGEQLRAALGVANTPAAIDAAAQAWVTDIRDRKDILVGGPGNDALLGGPGIDWIFGGDGNDVIFGGIDGGDEAGRTQRSNVLSGGEGDDTFQLVPHASADGGDPDDIDGGPGIDTIAYVGQYVVPSGSGLSAEDRDRVFVGYDVTQGFYRLAANVRLASTSIPSPSTFAGTVSGLAWRYVQFRPTGSEAFLLDVRGGDDQVFAQPGNTVNGRTWGIGRAQITAGARLKMVILGGDGDDRLFGTAGPDVMHGQGGSDFVKGFAGDDLLTGDDAGQTSPDTVVGDENDAGVTANTSVDTPQSQVGPFRQYGLLAAALTPRSDANLAALPAAWYPPSTPVTIASPGSSGGFLVKEGDAPVATPTFAATVGGPAWFTFTTKGDGGGSAAAPGEVIDSQNAERDRNFIRLLSAADGRTLVAGAVGATLRQAGPSTFVADAANASTPVVVRGSFGQVSHGLFEFDLSALLAVPLDTLTATLSLRTSSTAGGSLRVQTLTAEADMQAIGADGNARYADLSTVSVPAGAATVTLDLADAIRRAFDAGRTRIGVRVLPGQASTTVSINAPGRNATDATRLDMSVNAPGVVAAIFDEFGRPINTATGERLAVGAEAPTFGLIDMRTLQAGTYYLRVDRSGPGEAPVPYSIEVTPPAAEASWPSSSRDIIAGGAGLDHLVGGRGTDVIWDGVLGSGSGDTDNDVVHGETTEVSGSSGAITRTTPVGEDLIAKEPLPVNPSVQLTDPGIIAAARRSGVTLDAANRTTAATLAQAAWLDASHTSVAALEDLRWFVGLRSLTLAGNALPAAATVHHIWQPANARTVIEPANPRAYFDSNTLTPPAITALSLADNPLLPAAKLAGPVDALGSSPHLRMLDLDRAAPTGSIAGIAAFHDDETVIDDERHVSLRWLSLSGVLVPGALSVTGGQALEVLDVARNTGLNIAAFTGLASLQQLVLDGSTAASGSTFTATINTLETRTPRVGVSFDGETLAPRRNAVTVRQAGAYSTTLRTSDEAPRFRLAFNQPVFWSGPVSPFTLNDPAGQPVVPLTVSGQGTRFIEIAAPSVTTDGSYRLLITGGLADEAGNAVASSDRDLGVVIVDRAAPIVQMVSPAPGSVSTSSVTFIDVRIADAHAGVDVATINAANFAVTGGVVTGVTAQAGGVWRLALASALAEGPFTVSVQAAAGQRVGDLVGNAVADGVIGTGMVDLLAPAGTVVGRGPVVNDDPGFVDIRWSDGAGTGLDAASFAPGNIAVTGVSVIEVETLADGVRRYRYAGRLSDGMISVTVGAQPVRDLTGRAATGEVGSFRLDSTALVGRLIAPNGQAVTSYATSFDAGFVDVRWDDGSGVGVDASTIGIDDLDFSQAGIALTRVESRGGGVYRYHYASSTSRLTDQRVTTVLAVAGAVLDLAGNALQAGPVGDVIFDTLGPVATLQSPAGVVRMPAADERYVDLRWDDLTGLAAGLPAAADIVFVSGGVTLAAAVTQVEVVAGGLHRYRYAPALPDGQIEVRVRAGALTADGAGNRAAPHVAGTFTIDATGPRAALVGPSDGQVVSSSVWDIDVLLSDADGSGVDWTTVTPAAFTISRGTLASVALLSGDVVRLQMASALGEGPVTVSVGGSSPIRDRFGNAMAARVVGVFTVDLAAPTATLESEGWTGDITADRGHVDVRWSDGQGAGIDPASIKPANIRISGVTVDEVIMLEPGLFRYVYNADGDRLPLGAVTVETSSSSFDAVRDQAGRTAAAAVLASGTCVIDREPPRLVGSSLRSGALGWETLTLTFSERVNAATLIASGSISDLFTLTASDGGRVRLEASRFAWNDATRQLTIDLTVDGPGGSTLGMASKGTWWIVMRTGVVFDASGNGMMDLDGMEDGMFRIDLPLPRSARAGGPQ